MNHDFVPVSIDLLNEGAFLKEVQDEFQAAKDALIAHVDEHGLRIKKATSVVTVEISIDYEDCDGGGAYSITTHVKHKRPAPPARGSRVSRLAGDGGEIDLFVQPSGSRDESPMQGRLAQTDGTGLDPNTGLPSEERTLKIGRMA